MIKIIIDDDFYTNVSIEKYDFDDPDDEYYTIAFGHLGYDNINCSIHQRRIYYENIKDRDFQYKRIIKKIKDGKDLIIIENGIVK